MEGLGSLQRCVVSKCCREKLNGLIELKMFQVGDVVVIISLSAAATQGSSLLSEVKYPNYAR